MSCASCYACFPCCKCCAPPFRDCPTHPKNPLQKICMDKLCLEPICAICAKDHINMHNGIGTPHQIRNLADIKDLYLDKIDKMQPKSEPQTYNIGSACQTVKYHANQFFKRLPKRNTYQDLSQSKVQLRNSNVKTLLDVVEDDNKVQIPPNFRQKLHQFLAMNLEINPEVTQDFH